MSTLDKHKHTFHSYVSAIMYHFCRFIMQFQGLGSPLLRYPWQTSQHYVRNKIPLHDVEKTIIDLIGKMQPLLTWFQTSR